MSDPLQRLSAALEGRYRVERALGEGGMATVYLAHDERHNRKVALKVLKPELAAVVGAERFLAEIETTAGLQHPHILPLFDSGEADGFLFYVMPYVDGESLRDRLDREKQLPVQEAISIATKVAGALQAAHERGVVHRDVKPANILLAAGEPLVADFGIALAVSAAGGGRLTETGLSLGTPYYMSPEQATADRDPDARSDVYSLACVLYEMLAGEPPHTGSTAQAVLARILTDRVRPVRELRASVPDHVEAALEHGLEKLPADRFGSAAELARALGEPGFGRSRGGPARSARGTKPVAAPLLAAAAALVAGALLGRATAPGPEPRPPTRWIYHPDSTHVVTGRHVAISPDARTVVYRGFRILGGTGLYARRLGDLEGRRIGVGDGDGAFFSPDGSWIGAFDFSRNPRGNRTALVKVAVESGRAVELTDLAVAGAGAAGTWSDHGTIYFTDRLGGLYQVSDEGGASRPVTVEGMDAETRYYLPQYVPGHEALLLHYGVEPVTEDALRMGLLSLRDGSFTDLGPGLNPRLGADVLVYLEPSRQLVVRPFDARRARFTGDPVPLGVTLWLDRVVAPFALAPDGTLVYARDAIAEARAVMVRPGGEEVALDLPIGPVNHFDSPRMSPDGRRLAIVASVRGGHQPYVVDLAAGTALRLTSEPGVEFLQWTPDGDSLVYVSGSGDLLVGAADRGGEPRVLIAGPPAPVQRLSVGRTWIAYATDSDERGGAIEVLPRSGGQPVSYLDTPADEYAPAISPDGRWLAYVSDEDGRPEVFVRSFPEPSGPRAVSSGGGVNPAWHPDGRSVYYRGLGREVIQAHVALEGAFTVTGRDTVLVGAWEVAERSTDYDVLPDGTGLLMLGLRQELDGLVVVLDALSEITGTR